VVLAAVPATLLAVSATFSAAFLTSSDMLISLLNV
jgi:hypothetical protein